jgi:hypothetical protein
MALDIDIPANTRMSAMQSIAVSRFTMEVPLVRTVTD